MKHPDWILAAAFSLLVSCAGSGTTDESAVSAAEPVPVFTEHKHDKETPKPMNETLEIIYIHGWLQNGPHPEHLAVIEDVFPGCWAEQHTWASFKPWVQARDRADVESELLSDKLSALPQERLDRTVLIGHSLGGRMTVRVLARLSERGKRVRQGILLAAAIPDDDPDIEKAFHGTLSPILNFCNPDDLVLKYCYGVFGEQTRPPLGANGLLRKNPYFYDIHVPNEITSRVDLLPEPFDSLNLELVKKTANHHAVFYLEYMQETIASNFCLDQPLIVPQDKVNLELQVSDKLVFWVEEDSFEGWSLQRHTMVDLYRIVDNEKHRRAWGSKSRMLDSFNKVKEQLNRKKK